MTFLNSLPQSFGSVVATYFKKAPPLQQVQKSLHSSPSPTTQFTQKTLRTQKATSDARQELEASPGLPSPAGNMA